MRRWLLVLMLAAGASGALSATAVAHPLGNFSVNHLTKVRVSADRIDVRYILDQAEIPTFQERGQPAPRILTAKRNEVLAHLRVTVDGRPVPLVLLPGARISYPPGQGGLPLTRVELPLRALISRAHKATVDDETFGGRVGWKAIVSEVGTGTAVRTDAPTGDPTNELRVYPTKTLSSPLDQRRATFTSAPGDGSLIAPKGLGTEPVSTNRGGDGLAGLFSQATAGKGVLLFLLLAAFGWGALHALSPGHGKGMVAAYLVGSRGTARHALALGGIVTFTHTVGVFGLGAVTLLLSQYVFPDQLYPWLTLASGLMVLIIGAGAARSRIRSYHRARKIAGEHGHGHHRAHEHRHNHEHAHDHGHTHGHGPGQHTHEPPDRITGRGLLLMGASAGLIPCPSALVVLLGAIAQHQVGLGLLLIVVFSLGLAMTLTALGVAVVKARALTSRFDFGGRLATALPAVSALVIMAAGMLLTAQALPKLA